MATNFDPETQMLVLKAEYTNDPIEVKERRGGFGGVIYEATVAYFDPAQTPEVEYAYFFDLGLDYIFDIITK